MRSRKTEYSIIRYKKCNQQTVIEAWKHNNRVIQVPNADGSKYFRNISISNNDRDKLPLMDKINNRIREAGVTTVRKDAIYAIELVLTATPSFFARDKGSLFDLKKNCEKSRLKNWFHTSVEWLKSEYGENLMQAQLHLDETTPHIHAFFVPLIELEKKEKVGYKKYETQLSQRLSAAELITIAWSYKLHDSYSNKMSHLGLVRGRRGVQQSHVKLKHRNESEHEISKREKKLHQLKIQINTLKAEADEAHDKINHLKMENDLHSTNAELASTELKAIKDELAIARDKLKRSNTENVKIRQLNSQLKNQHMELTSAISEADSLKKMAEQASNKATEQNNIQQAALRDISKRVTDIASFHQSAVMLVNEFSTVYEKFGEHVAGLNTANSVKDQFDHVLDKLRATSSKFMKSKNSNAEGEPFTAENDMRGQKDAVSIKQPAIPKNIRTSR